MSVDLKFIGFLLADYAMEWYENFHSLKQIGMAVEEYTLELNNLSIRVGFNKPNEQMPINK